MTLLETAYRDSHCHTLPPRPYLEIWKEASITLKLVFEHNILYIQNQNSGSSLTHHVDMNECLYI
jgi:hypothetical protein